MLGVADPVAVISNTMTLELQHQALHCTMLLRCPAYSISDVGTIVLLSATST